VRLPEGEFVLARGYDAGFSTNLPLADFLAEDALVAFLHDGQPLTEEHGWPARLIVPQLYAWKSAKWIAGLELLDRDKAGFWERNGTTCMAIRGRKNVLAGDVLTRRAARNARLGQWAGAARYARKAAPEYFKRYREERKCAVPPAPFTPHPKRWSDTGLHAAWLGAQHGAAEDRRIHDPDGPHPGRALRSANGSGDGGPAPAGGAGGEPRNNCRTSI